MPRKQLNDSYVRSLKPAPAGKRYMVTDAILPAMKVRVTDRGAKSFVLWRHYGGASSPAARVLGTAGAMTVAEARAKAREWLALLQQGHDPAAVAAAAAKATAAREGALFSAVLDDYLRQHVSRQRRAKAAELLLRRELLTRWANKPVTSITRDDVLAIVDAIKERGALFQAHNTLAHIKTFFSWAIERNCYGLETNPAAVFRNAKRLIGAKQRRERVLTDAELRLFWRAAAATAYPYGPLFKFLAMTGQRKSDVAEAQWPEFDVAEKVWRIPAARYKTNTQHTVPLTEPMLALLATLPRWNAGDFVFSTTGGTTACNGFGNAKTQLDKAMQRLSVTVLQHFVTHDVRRTVRTRLAGLRVRDEVAELCIGHSKRGIVATYNRHQYLQEMREALAAWNAELARIVGAGA